MEEIKERYVQRKLAVLLRMADFKEIIHTYYVGNDDSLHFNPRALTDWNNFDHYYSAPTQQMAREWIETKYKLFIEIRGGADIDRNGRIIEDSVWFDYDIIPLSKNSPKVPAVPPDDGIVTYEHTWEALEAAMEYILTDIILSPSTVEPDKDDFDRGFTKMMLNEL